MDTRLRAYLFDQVPTTDPASVLRMNERIAACYAWAERHGFTVADEIIAWPDASRPAEQVLAELLQECHRERAVLLVHSLDVLPGAIPAPWRGVVPLVVAT